MWYSWIPKRRSASVCGKMARYFDSHAHYYDAKFYADGQTPDALLDTLFAGEVGTILNIGTSLENAGAVLSQAAKYPRMYAALGIHPTDGQGYADPAAAVEELALLLGDAETRAAKKIVAIGEIGLDYHYPDTDKAKQGELLERQLCLAEKLDLPVIIHDREAHGDCFEAVLRHPHVRGVFHSFSGSAELARELTRRGWYLSFSGVVTFKNAPRVREAVAATPEDRLLTETDCPYLAPEPHRGERNCSGFLPYTVAAMAAVKGKSVQEMTDLTAENACRLFGIPRESGRRESAGTAN